MWGTAIIIEKMHIKGTNVLITGGASGIGRIMGRICLEKGASNLIVWDINQANIDKTEAELSDVKPAEAGVKRSDSQLYSERVGPSGHQVGI